MSLRPGSSPGLFRFGLMASGYCMTERYSKSPLQAETAFSDLQAEFFAKNNAAEELASMAYARNAKTPDCAKRARQGARRPNVRPPCQAIQVQLIISRHQAVQENR